MNKSKKTIKRSILFSHIAIITIAFIFITVVFDICLRVYVKRQTIAQLNAVVQLLEKSMTATVKGNEELRNQREVVRNLLTINKTLKRPQAFLDINYVLLGENNEILYPVKETEEEYRILEEKLLPVIEKKKKGKGKGTSKKAAFLGNIDGKQYAIVIDPLDAAKNGYASDLIIYSDLEKNEKVIDVVNIILISILFVVAMIAFIISNSVSKRITRPIAVLQKYANKIGEREYDAEFISCGEGEIEDLAETMHAMAEKISLYDKTMKNFMQNASHELRTPLMSIQGYAESIKYGVVEEEEKAVDIIIEESIRLSELVEDLLFLSKLDGMQEELNNEEMNVEDLLRSSIERLNGITIKNNKIINLICKEKNIMMIGDEEKLIRAIINVLGNALRYAKEYINIIVEKEGANIKIRIEDDGPGLPENEASAIFERFFKGKGGNYGLGLAITKSIIEKHNGKIFAENKNEGGACFTIILAVLDIN